MTECRFDELDGRLCMMMDTDESFSFERKARMDAANPQVQEWEALMAKFQDASVSDRRGHIRCSACTGLV